MLENKRDKSLNLFEYINPQNAQRTYRLILLGASGSIGQTTLRFLEEHPSVEIDLVALSVHTSLDFLRAYLRKPPPTLKYICISSDAVDSHSIKQLQTDYPSIKFYQESHGLLEMISVAEQEGADTILTAIVGAAGIQATLHALKLGLKIALANKETLVTAGPAIQALCKKQKAKGEIPVILPVDSEHSSVFRLLDQLSPSNIRRIILTASGGPFRELSLDELARVDKAMVLQHPTWSMGAKITVDSAGMVNKGLELIEAHYLFGLPYPMLHVWIHSDSIVHAIGDLSDGSFLFHASAPDMVFPIAHALLYPETLSQRHSVATQPPQWPALGFSEVDKKRYPGFHICLAAAHNGGTATAILNATNEIAVAGFLKDQIHFTQIPDILESVMNMAKFENGSDLGLYLEADAWARVQAQDYLKKL